MDDGFEAGRFDEVQLGVCDETADLDDLVGFRVQACHLVNGVSGEDCKIRRSSVWIGDGTFRSTSQSIQTKGSVERSSGIVYL